MFIVCGRGNLAAAFCLDKKLSVVQVEGGGKTGGFPARNLIFQDVKKVDGGFWPGGGSNSLAISRRFLFFLFILFYFLIDKYSNLYYHVIVDAYKVGSAVNLTS